MELRHLRYFVAVAEELNFGRAAERLHLAQPPLSRQIMQLEREVGATLLERTKRSVRLTSAGAVFLDNARAMLALADEAVIAARRVAEGHAGTLTLAFVGSAMLSILPEILREARHRLPEVNLVVNEMTTGEQVDALLEDGLDAAFLRPGVVHPELTSVAILREDLVVGVPVGHRLSSMPVLSIRALERETIIVFSRKVRPSFGDQVLSLCIDAGFTPKMQDAFEIQTALGLVASGAGVSVLPGSVARLTWPDVVLIPIAPPTPQSELSVAYRRDARSSILPHFLEVVREVSARFATPAVDNNASAPTSSA